MALYTLKQAVTTICLSSLVVGTTFTASPANSCTTFSLSASLEKAYGKSYDWPISSGFLVVNKRDMQKTGFPLLPNDNPAAWVSKFGSLTFNQYGREFPNGGINEAGLIVDVMVLGGQRFPAPTPTQPSVNELQWVQYQLDNFATIAEVVAHAGDLRIAKVVQPLHYLVCEKSGKCATVEWFNGSVKTHQGGTLPQKVLTNGTYEASVASLARYTGFGGSRPIPTSLGSADRFVRAASEVQEFNTTFDPSLAPAGAAVDAAFDILDSVGPGSAWHIVYEGATSQVHFRTSTAIAIKHVDATAFNFACGTTVRVLDVESPQGGAATADFSDYTRAKNKEVVEKALTGQLPQAVIDRAVAYPESMHCIN